jgi:lysophospholipase L1-like esterase
MENKPELQSQQQQPQPAQQQPLPQQSFVRSSKRAVFVAAILLFLILGGITLVEVKNFLTDSQKKVAVENSPTPTIKKEKPFETYTYPQIERKDVYTIFMVGDSMTELLGPHGGKLSEFLNTLYQSTPGNQRIVIDNYATGSTNLLGLKDAMNQSKSIENGVLEPLLSKPFDILLIESFGYNPLSQLGVEEGLKKQTQLLNELMTLLTNKYPDSAIIFVATIAPNKATYGQESSPGNTVAQRTAQAEERSAYIKNHMTYAQEHDIPLIDIYTKSLTPQGDGNLLYINPGDHIHPSAAGIDFISNEIANFIYEQEILPK